MFIELLKGLDSDELFEKLNSSERNNLHDKLCRNERNEGKRAIDRLRILSESQSNNIFKPKLPENSNKIINDLKSPLSKSKINHSKVISNINKSFNKDKNKDNEIMINNVKNKAEQKKNINQSSPLSKAEYLNLPVDVRLIYYNISNKNNFNEDDNNKKKTNTVNKKKQNEMINRLVYEYEVTNSKIESIAQELYSIDSVTGQPLFNPVIPVVPKNCYGGTIVEKEDRNVTISFFIIYFNLFIIIIYSF